MMRNVFVFTLLCFSISLFSQHKINGLLTDPSGEPLPGANVVIKQLKRGTVSGLKGKYAIEDIPTGKYTIKVSFVGYDIIEEEVSLDADKVINFVLAPQVISGEEIIVRATRAGGNTPTTFSEVDKETIKSKNLGQDIPFLLGMEPSLVTTSDAGAGVGYTGLWIRGSNIQRINVTVNGVPLNDPESHGVYWVNMPDFASSLESAQIQRGVGTSTNGGGAFGATINLETSLVEKEPFAELNTSYGSFNTFKRNARFGTGLIKDKWAFEGRLSKITSDGYIDRAESDLSSYFLQGGYYTEKTTVKAVAFSGKEKTYQSWNGIDKESMKNLGRTFNSCGVVFGKKADGTTDAWNYDNIAYYYDNETDNYQQDNYQLHLNQRLSQHMAINISGHYTYGRGYYEQFKQDESLEDYGVGNQYFGLDSTLQNTSYVPFYHDTITTGDFIVRRWLDNQFYGSTFALNYSSTYLDATLGGAWNKYANARHYGEVIWAQYAGDSKIRNIYYDNESNKTDLNSYLKAVIKPTDKLSIFADLQVRAVGYTGEGTDKGGGIIDIDEDYIFFNPKMGISYNHSKLGTFYGSVSMANREPIRTDFVDAPEGVKPEPENLLDGELGVRKHMRKGFYNVNAYYMLYKNQLVLTGEINDVGSPIRSNVGESYRMGVELDGGMQPSKWFMFRANAAISNSNTDFKQEEDSGIKSYNDVQISFSPQLIAGAELTFIPIENINVAFTSKHVSKQYLDLTNSEELSLDEYTIVNVRLACSIHPDFADEITISLLINNLLSTEYSSNGYVYYGTAYYYPQAGMNLLGGITVRF